MAEPWDKPVLDRQVAELEILDAWGGITAGPGDQAEEENRRDSETSGTWFSSSFSPGGNFIRFFS